MPTSDNLTVGTPDIAPDAPAHISGVRQGNRPGGVGSGFDWVDGKLKANARRSTGICPDSRDPITPGAPNLPPA